MTEPGDGAFAPRSTALGRATIGDSVRRQGARQPRRPAVIEHRPDGSRRVTTYAELASAAARVSSGLRALGVGRGDVVAVLAPSSTDYVIAYLGTLGLGAAVTGIGWRSLPDDVAWQVDHAGATTLLVGQARLTEVDALRDRLPGVARFVALAEPAPPGWLPFSRLLDHEPLDPAGSAVTEDDLALLTYTSGSEARPKGVRVPHRNYTGSTAFSLLAAGYAAPDDVYLFIKPFHTIAGLGSLTTLLLVGATVVLVEPLDPARALDVIEVERITTISQTPTFYTALSQHPRFASADLSSVRSCHTYGGLVARPMVEAFAAVAPHVRWASYWGQSELTQLGTIGWFRSFDDIPAGDPRWIGVPTPNLEVRVVDADDQETDTGELWCRSPSVMAGYHRDPERTAAAVRDGWLRTGDLVHRDAEGNLFFLDRIKDVVKTGGMNVSSLEVEDALLRHPSVGAAAVVGLPDDYWGEAVTAFVVARPGATVDPDELVAFCREHLTIYKVPKAVHVIDALPTDPQGKVRKRELRQRS